MMILDLNYYEIIHEMGQDPGTIPNNVSDMVIPHLKKEVWVVI